METLKGLGFTRSNLSSSITHSFLITAAGLAFLTGFGILTGTLAFRSLSIPAEIFYVLVSVPIQELIFRGILQTRLEARLARPLLAVVIASLIFSAVHFYNPLMVGLTLMGGLAWGFSFSRTRNLLGPILSHACLGVYLSFLVI